MVSYHELIKGDSQGLRLLTAFGSFCLRGVCGGGFVVISKILVELYRPPIVVS